MFFSETQWEGYGDEDNTWQKVSSFYHITPELKRMMRRARENREANSFSAKNMEQPNSLYELSPEAQAYMDQPNGEYVRSDLLFESVMDSLPTNNYRGIYQPGPTSIREDYEEITSPPSKEFHTTKMIHTLTQLKRLRRGEKSPASSTDFSRKKHPGGLVSRKVAVGGSILHITMSNPHAPHCLPLWKCL